MYTLCTPPAQGRLAWGMLGGSGRLPGPFCVGVLRHVKPGGWRGLSASRCAVHVADDVNVVDLDMADQGKKAGEFTNGDPSSTGSSDISMMMPGCSSPVHVETGVISRFALPTPTIHTIHSHHRAEPCNHRLVPSQFPPAPHSPFANQTTRVRHLPLRPSRQAVPFSSMHLSTPLCGRRAAMNRPIHFNKTPCCVCRR